MAGIRLPQQPIRRALLPAEDDSTLALGSLNHRCRVPWNDFSTNGNDGTVSGGVVNLAGGGATLDGTNGKIDYGDIGNIVEIAMWINPGSTTEEIVLVDTGADIMVSTGTVTYTGLTASATYVNGSAGTTLAADEWSHLVCQFTQDDANNFELGTDGANYGDIQVRDLRAYTTARTAAAIAADFAAGVPDSTVVLAMDGTGVDRSRYSLGFTPQADAIVGGKWMSFDGTGDYHLSTSSRDLSAAGTIIVWFRPGDTTGVQVLAATSVSTSNRFVIQINGTVLEGGYWNGSGWSEEGGGTVAANQWFHGALTWNGTTMSTYLNGVAVSGATTAISSASNANTTVGARTAGTTNFNGDVGLVKMYSSAKATAYIAQHYAQTRGCF